MKQAVERMLSTKQKGDVWSVWREANYFKHCLINSQAKLKHGEHELKRVLNRNPHLVVGAVDAHGIQKAKEAMIVVYRQLGLETPKYVLEAVERQLTQMVEGFQKMGSDRDWRVALVFEFGEDDATIKRWLPVLIP